MTGIWHKIENSNNTIRRWDVYPSLPFSSCLLHVCYCHSVTAAVITDSEKESMMLLTINLSCFHRVMSAFTFPQCLNTRMSYGVRGAPGEMIDRQQWHCEGCLSTLPVRVRSPAEKSVWLRGDFSLQDTVKHKLSFYPSMVLCLHRPAVKDTKIDSNISPEGGLDSSAICSVEGWIQSSPLAAYVTSRVYVQHVKSVRARDLKSHWRARRVH